MKHRDKRPLDKARLIVLILAIGLLIVAAKFFGKGRYIDPDTPEPAPSYIIVQHATEEECKGASKLISLIQKVRKGEATEEEIKQHDAIIQCIAKTRPMELDTKTEDIDAND